MISLAGHTRGSVGLLLEKERLLLAGDGLNPTLLLLGGEAAPIGQLRQTLEAAEQLPFDPGIFPAIPRGRCRKSRWDSICAHLDCLRTEPPSHPGPYGPRICRSLYKEAGGRSVILFDRGLVEDTLE